MTLVFSVRRVIHTAGMTIRAVPAFRAVAIAEAISWAGLLVGMMFKYLVVGNDIGVTVFGPIHGGLFLFYLAVTVLVRRPLRWNVRTTALALLASVPPLATLVFERWATRTGRLAAAESVILGR